MKRLIFSFSILMLATPAFSQDIIEIKPSPVVTPAPQPGAPSKCVSKVEMQEIARHFKQFAPQANADYCYDGSAVSNLISSLMFMRHTPFSDKMNASKDELFTGRFASSWYNYFIGRIDKLEIVGSCPKGVVAYVYGFGGKTMYACPLALTDTFSSLDRASVFMHEARHIDGFPHMTCSKGPRQGLQGACDTRISDGGSYAVTVETYAQLAKYATDLHPALKAYARSSAVVYADEAFENKVRINRSEGLLLLSSNLDFLLMNLSGSNVETLGKSTTAGHIIHRAQHLVLIPDDKTLNTEYVFARNEGAVNQSPGEIFTEYNGQTPEQKAQLVDIHVGAQWTARVYKTSVKMACDPKATTINDVQIPSGKTPANLIYLNGYDRAASSTHLMMQTGEIYELGCASNKGYLKLASGVAKLDQNYKRLYKVGNQSFGLSQDGKVFSVRGSTSTQVAASLGASIIEIIPYQSFDFFETP